MQRSTVALDYPWTSSSIAFSTASPQLNTCANSFLRHFSQRLMAPTGPTFFSNWSLVDFGTDSAIPYLQGWRFFLFEHASLHCEESRHQFHVLRVKRRFGIHSLLPFVIFASIFLDGLAQSFSRSYRLIKRRSSVVSTDVVNSSNSSKS